MLTQNQQRLQINDHQAKVSKYNDNNYRVKTISNCRHNGFCLQTYCFQQQKVLKICHKFLEYSTFAYVLRHYFANSLCHHFAYSFYRYPANSLGHKKSNTYYTSFIVFPFWYRKHYLLTFHQINISSGNNKAILIDKEHVCHYIISKGHFMTWTQSSIQNVSSPPESAKTSPLLRQFQKSQFSHLAADFSQICFFRNSMSVCSFVVEL